MHRYLRPLREVCRVPIDDIATVFARIARVDRPLFFINGAASVLISRR